MRQILTKRNLFLILAITTLPIAALGAARVLQNQPTQLDEKPGRIVLDAIIARKTDELKRQATYSARVESSRISQIGFQRAGRVDELLVDEGDVVKKGQVLARLDDDLVKSQLAGLEAQEEQAQAVLDQLKKGLDESVKAAVANVDDLTEQLKGQDLRLARAKGLDNENAISKEDYEAILYTTKALEARLRAATAQSEELNSTRPGKIAAQEAIVRSIQAEIDAAQVHVNDCELVAPFDGTVVRRFVDEGTVASIGTPVFELVDENHLEVHAGLPESAVSDIAPGDLVPVLLDGGRFDATVKTILPKIDPNTRTRKAILEIAEADSSRVVTGQLVQVSLSRTVPDAGFWVPATAITSSQRGLWTCYTLETSAELPDPGDSYGESDWMIQNGVIQMQSVEVLYRQEEIVFVRGTLQDGQVLITSGLHRVVPGNRVTARISGQLMKPVSATQDAVKN